MTRATFEIAVEWTEREREPNGPLDYWLIMRCDDLPAGFDYFVFDTALVCGLEVTMQWVRDTVDIVEVKDRIAALEKLRRLRDKVLMDWKETKAIKMNRVLRARQRAFKLLEGRV